MQYPTRKAQRLCRPRLESLEDRFLPSASPAPTIDLGNLQMVNTSTPTQILVDFSPASASGVAALPGTSLGTSLPLVAGLYEVNLAPGMTVKAALQEYQADPAVRYAEPNSYLTTSSIPNDPQFGSQLDMGNINATYAWNVTTGSANVTVAVMDSGIDYDQPDLYQNVWINQAEIPTLPFAPGSGLSGSRRSLLQDTNGDGLITFADLNNPVNQGAGKITDVNGDGVIDAADILAPMQTETINGVLYDTGKGGWVYTGNTQDGDTAHPNDFIGWNFVNNTNNPYDDFGHGTHVSGTIGAVGNNGTGVAGIDWSIQIMPVKFLDSSGQGSIADFIQGLNYAVQHGAKISNNSWAGAGYSQALYDAVSSARAAGQIFVAAAGNNGVNIDSNPTYPASLSTSLDNVVAVAATDQNNNLASFSDYGPQSVALAAPGVNVLSTLPNDSYGYDSGTSMATPHVTGVMALVWADHPTWTYNQVINQVLSTAAPMPSLQGLTKTGGLLDAAAALGIPDQVSTPTVSAQTLINSSGSVVGVQLTFSRAMNPATINSGSVTLTSPGGTVSYPAWVSVVSGSNSQSFQIGFNNVSTPGTWVAQISPAAHDANGNPIRALATNLTVLGGATPQTPPPATPPSFQAQVLQNSSGAAIGVVLSFGQSMNPATVNSSSVTVVSPTGTIYYPDWVNVVSGSNNQTFQLGFSKMTTPGTWTVRVSANAHTANGNPITPVSASLTVSGGTTTTPHVLQAQLLQNSSGVAIGIVLTFDRSMNPATVNSGSVTITLPNGVVIYPNWVNVVAGSNNTQFLLGFSGLTGTGPFVVTVTSRATDSNGNPIVPFQGPAS